LYKMVIVDDDEIVREAIENDIDWESNGITVVGTAKDGMEGLELIKEVKPQIILSDIRMPFLDGLEMVEKALKMFPHVKIVFLTAYEDFEFAKQAIHLKITEYVLKYVDNQDIVHAVLRAKCELIEEKEMRDRLEMSVELARNKFLGDLISAVVSEQYVTQHTAKLGIRFEGNLFAVAVLGIDDYVQFSSSKHRLDLELAIHSIMNITNEILFTQGKGLAFSKYDNYVKIIFNSAEYDDFNESIYENLEEIIYKINKYLKIEVSIGVGNTFEGVSNIKLSYNDAVQALEMRTIMNRKGIITIDSIKFNETAQDSLFKKLIDYVDINFTEKLSLNELASEVNVSHTYICTLFRKYKSCTLSNYIIGVRIAKAKDLLKNTNMKTYEVSEKVGYSNPQYFSILFKKCTGYSPTEYKNKHLK
jgi:two-component system response regulator YesN